MTYEILGVWAMALGVLAMAVMAIAAIWTAVFFRAAFWNADAIIKMKQKRLDDCYQSEEKLDAIVTGANHEIANVTEERDKLATELEKLKEAFDMEELPRVVFWSCNSCYAPCTLSLFLNAEPPTECPYGSHPPESNWVRSK